MGDFKKETDIVIAPDDIVTVTSMNHIVEIQHMEKMNRTNHIRKLDKFHYVDLRTGEKKEFSISENRSHNLNSLRQSFKKMRYLINNNFLGNPNELHLTLTYEENMTDPERLYDDFKNFFKRLRYKFKGQTTIDYISVVEPQGRGAWHCHVLLRFNDLKSIFIPNDEMRDLWGQGFVTLKTLNGVDNIGAYLSAYLADVEIECTPEMQPNETLKIVDVNGVKKAFVKGARLHMYPPGMNLFRKSNGMKYPDRERMTYKKAKKIVGAATPHYQKKYTVETEDFSNQVSFVQYNLKRV